MGEPERIRNEINDSTLYGPTLMARDITVTTYHRPGHRWLLGAEATAVLGSAVTFAVLHRINEVPASPPPTTTVQRFFELVDLRDFPAAFRMQRYQPDEKQFAAGYAGTARTRLVSAAQIGNSAVRPALVAIVLVATTTDAAPQCYTGTLTVDGGLITRSELQTHEPAQCLPA